MSNKRDEDITVEISSPGHGSSGPMSMQQFRDLPKKLKEVTRRTLRAADGGSSIKLSTRPLVYGDQDPESYFVEFPLTEDFEDRDAQYICCTAGSPWHLAAGIGDELRRSKRPDLKTARIGYLWKQSGGQRSGKAVLGKAVKATALVRTFTDWRGFVVLSADHCRSLKLTRWQMEALIFHELGHFRLEDGVLNTQGHDFEAFKSEVEEYGLWTPDLQLASAAFKQIELPGVATK